MVTNTIMMKLKNHGDAAKVKEMLEGMMGQIDTLLEARAYIDEARKAASYDILYISRFPDKDGQQKYVEHPVHVGVAAALGEYVETMAMVGYEE